MNVFEMVTTRHSSAYTDYALRSFFQTTQLGDGDLFVLIDNDASYGRAPDGNPSRVTFLKNRAPRGFAANLNQGMRTARERRADLFFLNNDLVFTPGWLEPLLVHEPVVLSPLSNFQRAYRQGGFACGPVLELSDYLGHEEALRQIARAHQATVRGYRAALGVPFFCVKIPHAVYAAVGGLDEGFGPGGGEDCDYCLRCQRAGFGVGWALGSYVLHFMGRSSWRGAETPAQSRRREQQYQAAFRAKWGERLLELMVFGKLDSLLADPSLWREYQQGNFKLVIDQLLGTDQPEPQGSHHAPARVPLLDRQERGGEPAGLPEVGGRSGR